MRAQRSAGDELRYLARWLPRMATAGLVLAVVALVEFIWLGMVSAIPMIVPGLMSLIFANVVTRWCRPLILANADRLDRTEP